uniref:Mei2-like C-terminal RNA recognition motif domain-containing protein n=1 Tax=Noctiluca scintillans TaxID=2966 RepID=A0A7S1AAS7_NOCSC|mmetsp:Transcript_37753/g.100441  ORF Transcript_37753/g.100441 Transcript_37753/m.100441 type:complete len:281 (+) Transcript_37753:60-902(+)|eukprot:CAMPEP_0194504018 /NCGR_PEP_ID=MMETSP0253-20130528/28705_1 /TAXON_ID=2966 /ORGANISM="Noctiluca scintillans" /LENGTH=280 /DNA_ID=CAMNT_0039346359 /DNA_START=25 /DNA_END=867 /DNA_ORIENTATION=+
MPTFVCKNTFISLKDGDEKQSTRSLFRSKSEEPSPRPVNSDLVDETATLQLMRLNSFFSDTTCATSGVSDDLTSTESENEDLPITVQHENDIVRELRDLQRRLREALSLSSPPQAASARLCCGDFSEELRGSHVREASSSPNTHTRDASVRQSHSPTTIVIRNVPKTHAQTDLIAELEGLGFAGTFDFLHLPLGKDVTFNLGYAFVNFIGHTFARQCTEALQGYTFQCEEGSSGTSASVDVAHIQGLGPNMMHFENSAVNSSKHIERRPVVVANLSQLIG